MGNSVSSPVSKLTIASPQQIIFFMYKLPKNSVLDLNHYALALYRRAAVIVLYKNSIE